MNIFDRLESNVRIYCRSFDTVFVSARGSVLTDENGKSYIDFLAGSGALNYGHNDPDLKTALLDYLDNDGLVHGLDLHTGAKRDFLAALEECILRPRNLEYRVQFTGPTGSDAVEAALKLCRTLKQRRNIIAFTNAYHGHTLGALAVTANECYRNEHFVNRNDVSFLPYDGYLGNNVNTMEYIAKVLDDPGSGVDEPAAILLETVQAEGGVNIAAREWLRELAALCRARNILLVVDDIQTGVGRTGSFFSFEDAGIRPDIVIMSKSLSGLGLPISLLLIKPELDAWKPGEHAGTFRGNNLAFVTAARSLRKFWQDNGLAEEVRRKGLIIREELERLRQRFPSAITGFQGKGMLYGARTGGRPLAGEIIRACFQLGLIMESCGSGKDALKISPPLTIGDDRLREGLALLAQGVAAATAKPLS